MRRAFTGALIGASVLRGLPRLRVGFTSMSSVSSNTMAAAGVRLIVGIAQGLALGRSTWSQVA